jgi:hypothetical protein|tara:strand:- start:977 stop:1108 length:132 start_codon:yes stop_codon:yes gene_type:complete
MSLYQSSRDLKKKKRKIKKTRQGSGRGTKKKYRQYRGQGGRKR